MKIVQYIFGAVLPVLALVPPLRSPPPSGAGASGFFLACYIAACISFFFLVQKFVLSLIVLCKTWWPCTAQIVGGILTEGP